MIKFPILARKFVLLTAAALGLATLASAQVTPISNYGDLATALGNGATSITNFNPTNSLTQPITINLTTVSAPTFHITNAVSIDAGTNSVIFQGNFATRFFFVHSTGTLTLNNVALINGGSTNGGAIYNQGTLILSNCVLQGNIATNGNGTNGGNGPLNGQGNGTNGAPGGNAAGGAIYNTGNLYIYSSILSNNLSQAGNGGNGGTATGAIGNGGTATGAIGNGGSAGSGGNSYGGAIYSVGGTNLFYLTEFGSNACLAGSGGTGGGFATNTVGATGAGGSGGAAGLGGSSAGGAAFVSGLLYMTNCLFYTNMAVAGSTGAAEVDSNGGGAEGSPGGSALGGALFLSNAPSAATIDDSIFYLNVCQGGNGGNTSLNAAVGGNGGAARGGGIWSSAGFVYIRFCTFAANYLFAGTGGTNLGGGIGGSLGGTNGWDIFRASGNCGINSTILSFGAVGTSNTPDAFGVTDNGENVVSDLSVTRSTILPTSRLNTAPLLDSGFQPTTARAGGNFGRFMPTLKILTNSPAAGFIPGVPGLTFPAVDEGLALRSTPTSAGAFEFNPLSSIQTNGVLPLPGTILPATNFTGAGGQVFFTNTVDTNGYTGLPFGYQWQFNGTNIYDELNYTGTTSNILRVKYINIANQGQYTVVISPSLLDGAVTSSVVALILTNPPVIVTQPKNQLGRPFGSIVTFTLGVASPLDYDYQWFFNGSPLPTNNEYSGTNSNVLTINPATKADQGTYSVIVSNNYGFKKSINVQLTISPDFARPTMTVTSPVNNSRTNAPSLAGTATDNAQVTNVFYWITNINAGLTNPVLAGNAVLTTNGSTNVNVPNTMVWTVPVAPYPGTNILAVQAVDYSSNVSVVYTRRFFYQVPQLFTLTVLSNGGGGPVTGRAFLKGDAPPTNNAMLNIGEGYSLTATPNSTSLLDSWNIFSGPNQAVAAGNTLKFVMQSNFVIQASFVSNIFTQIHGAYNGLFSTPPQLVSNILTTNTNSMVVTTNPVYTNAVDFASAGMVKNLSLGRQGTFTASLLLAGNSYPFSGTFNASGLTTNTVKRSTAQGGPLIVALSADTNGSGVITGSVTNAAWPTNSTVWASISPSRARALPITPSSWPHRRTRPPTEPCPRATAMPSSPIAAAPSPSAAAWPTAPPSARRSPIPLRT